MKITSIPLNTTLALITIATTGSALAQNTTQNNNNRDNPSPRGTYQTGATQYPQSNVNPSEGNRMQQGSATNVRVTRASNFLGTDVIANDGRKVGDVVDYFFDLGSQQHLAYVVIMTGGFLNMGGDTRAVPASAISVTGDNCRISISSDQFWDVPVLPENRQRFLSDTQHRQRIAQLFSQSGRTAGTGSSSSLNQSSQSSYNQPSQARQQSGWDQQTPANQQNRDQQASTSSWDDSSQAGGMTGRTTTESRLVSFNELRNSDAFGQQDTRLGFIQDAWINLNENRAPYIEITPTFQPFRTNFDRRYAIPTSKIAQKREYYGYTLNVTRDELNQAEPVSETEGVRMLEEGRIGNTVLRVTVPETNR